MGEPRRDRASTRLAKRLVLRMARAINRGQAPAMATYDCLTPLAWRDQAKAEAERHVRNGSQPCILDWDALERERTRNLVPGITSSRGVVTAYGAFGRTTR